MAKSAESRPLTPKQVAYRDGRISGLSGAEAYRKAYDASRMSPKAIQVEASRLDAHPTIALSLTLAASEHVQAVQERAAITTADVMRGLGEIAFVDIGELVRWDEDGHVTLTPSQELTKSQRNGIKKVTHVRRTIPQKNAEPIIEETVSLELEAKKGALDSLAKILGMLREQVDIRLIDDLASQMGLDRAEIMAEAERILRGVKA